MNAPRPIATPPNADATPAVPARPLRSRPPWLFRFAKRVIRARLRGGGRLIELCERLGWVACDVRYDLGAGVTLDVPLDRRPNQWDETDLAAYERELVERLADAVSDLPRPVRWIDVGADVGALTALVLARQPRPDEAWAFEPNPEAFRYLARNCARFPVPSAARPLAVSDRSGRGELRRAPTDDSPHAMFLAPSADGPLETARLDDLFAWTDGALVLKIDVEGGELAVLQGAEQLLRRLPGWCVSLEAHRDVARRTGIDPARCVRWLQALRPTTASVAERPDLVLDWSRDYFEQVPAELRIANIVCRSTG